MMKIELEFTCQECGEELKLEKDPEFRNGWITVDVPICESCKEKINDNAYNEGLADGYNQGVEETETKLDEQIGELEDAVEELKAKLEERDNEIQELRETIADK